MPPRPRATAKPAPTTAQALASLLKSARDIMRKDKGLNGDLDRLPLLTWIMFLKFLDDLKQQREQEAALAGTRFRPAIEPPYRWRDWAANPQGITGDELLAFINSEETVRPDGTQGPGLFAYLRALSSENGDDRRDVIATVFRGVDNRMRSGYLLRDVIDKVNGLHFTSSEELHTLGALYESMLREMRDAAGDSGEFYTPRALVRLMVQVTDPRLGETVLDPAAGTGGFLVEAFSHLAAQVRTVAERRVLQTASLFGCEPKPLPYLLCQMNLLLHGLDAPRIDPGNALRHRLAELGERDRVDVILTNPPFGGEEERGIQDNFPEDRRTAETALLFLQLIMRRLKRVQTSAGRPARAAVVVPNGTLFGDGVAARIKADLLEQFNLHTVLRLPEGVFAPYTDISTNVIFFDTSGPTRDIWFYEQPLPEGRRKYSKTRPIQFEEFAECLAWWGARAEGPRAWKVHGPELIRRDEAGRVVSVNLDLKNPAAKEGGGPPRASRDRRERDREGAPGAGAAGGDPGAGGWAGGMSGRWPTVPLGEILTRHEDWISIDPEKRYRQVTARLWGQGLALRGEVLGAEIAAASQNRVRAGQFLISKIDARHGAFGLVPDSLDGAIVSSDFPAFDVKASRALPAFVRWVSKTDWFVTLCKRASEGSTNRVRLREGVFLAQEIPLPPLDEQRRIVARLDAVEHRIVERRRAAEAMEAELAQLLAAAFRRITAGAPRARMGDVAPLVRRAVSVEFEGRYPEIGIRSFGKGTFHKPALSGADVGSKRLFEVHAGDLLFSNVFAWEGAVAVAQGTDHGRFGSHRFITRVADPDRASPEFLCFWFLTPEGLQQLGEASPGGAGRNRTLGLDALDRIEVPLPSLSAQQWFASLQQKARAAREAAAAATSELDHLLPALLAEAFGTGEAGLDGTACLPDTADRSASDEPSARPDRGRAVRRTGT